MFAVLSPLNSSTIALPMLRDDTSAAPKDPCPTLSSIGAFFVSPTDVGQLS